MSSIIRARSGLMGWWEASEVIRGASLELKVAGPSMLGIRRPDRHALPLATSPTRRQRFTHPPPAGAGSFHAPNRTTAVSPDVMRKSPKEPLGGTIEAGVNVLSTKSWRSMLAIRRSAPECDGSISRKRFPGRARIIRAVEQQSHAEPDPAAARRASQCRLGDHAASRVRQRGRDLIRSSAGLDGGDAYVALGRQRV